MRYSAENPLVVTDKVRREIAGAVAEVDPVVMIRNRDFTPAERVQQAISMIEAAERVGVLRLRQREPHLSEDEAYRIIRGGLLNYYRKQDRIRTWPPAP
jgi:hypothetical protein